MGFDKTGLSTYVANNSTEIALKAVTKSATAALLIANGAVQAGIKGSEKMLAMDADVVLQDGSACSRTASGTVKLIDKDLVVKPIKDVQDLCTKDLYNTYFAFNLVKGQSPEEEFTAEFSAKVMDVRAAKIAGENEKLLWQGDTSLTGTTNMKRIDGIIKQVGTGYTVTASGATTVNKLQSAVLTSKIDVRSAEDFRIFVGEDVYAEYLIGLANANIYKPTSDMTIFGTTTKLEVVPGLNGIRKIFTGRIKNFRLGLDGENDSEQASMRFSIETEKWYQDFKYALGVGVYDTSEVGVATV
ncbi:MAG: hypothetical protein EOO46_01370 [Flavobacterium sp.]|nr:MAG: hypothetical protein EOO46_01370 [Flavobacterium sp.]